MKNKPYFIKLSRKTDDPDSVTALFHRSAVMDRNRFLRRIYIDWYRNLQNFLPADIKGPLLEIGSGGKISKMLVPRLVTSDIIPAPLVDMVLDGQRLPFGKNSLLGILMVDVFHHIPDVELFLYESQRCLKPGGIIAMIEPWITPWSKFIYTFFHPEPCHTRTTSWNFPPGAPLSSSYQALPWIVFQRDRNRFNKRFKHLKIFDLKLHSPFSYLLSGGYSFPGFLPGKAYRIVKQCENRLRPFNPYLAMFATIVLKRTTRAHPVS